MLFDHGICGVMIYCEPTKSDVVCYMDSEPEYSKKQCRRATPPLLPKKTSLKFLHKLVVGRGFETIEISFGKFFNCFPVVNIQLLRMF